MSRIYGESHRELQNEFGTTKLADAVENVIVRSDVSAEDKAFIESRDMFFLSSIDHKGRPTVSYKGGDPGFVKVVDEKTIAFPSYDGNGMFLSMGNIKGNKQVGLLFIDFENPHRVRFQGEASIQKEDPLLASYVDADMIVRVTVSEMWKNCPRYIHRYKKLEPSTYVPRETCETPMPDWKRLDMLQPILPAKDQGKAEKQGGLLTIEELQAREQRDD
jgi:predicted pyridoxine 5'-phosphate oxidase superfamily flavin-nucleotide-binding protein